MWLNQPKRKWIEPSTQEAARLVGQCAAKGSTSLTRRFSAADAWPRALLAIVSTSASGSASINPPSLRPMNCAKRATVEKTVKVDFVTEYRRSARTVAMEAEVNDDVLRGTLKVVRQLDVPQHVPFHGGDPTLRLHLDSRSSEARRRASHNHSCGLSQLLVLGWCWRRRRAALSVPSRRLPSKTARPSAVTISMWSLRAA